MQQMNIQNQWRPNNNSYLSKLNQFKLEHSDNSSYDEQDIFF